MGPPGSARRSPRRTYLAAWRATAWRRKRPSTYALGKAFCYYYSAVLQGHVPDAADLKRYYNEQFAGAEQTLKKLKEPK